MGDFVLSVIPTDPRWRPAPEAGHRVAALLRDLAPDADQFNVDWHETITVVDCGENLQRITCPHCRRSIDPGWYGDLLEATGGRFDTLTITTPCCFAPSTLDALDYDWPVGYASFEVAVWNGLWEPLSETTLTQLTAALGHPVRQILSHL